MNTLSDYLRTLETEHSPTEKEGIVATIVEDVNKVGYEIVELNDTKPWGAYLRISSEQADRFVKEFFPGLTPEEARLGMEEAELSPKLLVVAPHQRLSWQYHNRRAERWTFLTKGGYYKSETDEPGEMIVAEVGDVVQFQQGERHRLVGLDSGYVIVAEIWQHQDKNRLSNEEDIIRLADDYKR